MIQQQVLLAYLPYDDNFFEAEKYISKWLASPENLLYLDRTKPIQWMMVATGVLTGIRDGMPTKLVTPAQVIFSGTVEPT